MSKLGWIIRLYNSNDYSSTITFVGNFQQTYNRRKDDVVAFSGMYGLDDYMIWYIHKDIENYDFSTLNLELELYQDMDNKKPFWHRQYKILDVKYDTKESRYVLYGISLDSAKLQTMLTSYNVKSLTYNENRNPKQVLIDILEANKIFKVEYIESPYEQDLRNFEYRYFNIDEDWRVYDFISYIADQNEFEWFVRNNVLYIGKECKAIRGMNSTRRFDSESDNVSKAPLFKKYHGDGRPMDVMAHISEVWRCIWCKHIAGSSGGISKGCFTRIGYGTLDKENYLKTLEGEPERSIASKLFINKPYSHYIGIGNIIKDEGELSYIDQVSVQKNKALYKVNEPSDIMIDRGDDSNNPITQIKERVSRMTPYADSNGAMLFPSPLLEEETSGDLDDYIKGNPPNAIILKVDGKEESSVIAGYVMGNSEENFKLYKIPSKGYKDFRFSLPNGWIMYIDGDYGKALFQCEKPPTIWDALPKENNFPYPGNENRNPNGQESTYIYMRPKTTEASESKHEISLNAGLGNSGEETGSKLTLTSNDGFYFTTQDGDKEVKVEFTKDKIILTATDGTYENKITIDAQNSTIDIDADSNVTINTNADAVINSGGKTQINSDGDTQVNASGKLDLNATGNVEIDGLQTLIQGGAKALAHALHTHTITATHTHTVSGVMPGPAAVVTTPPLVQDTIAPCSDNTTKTKAD